MRTHKYLLAQFTFYDRTGIRKLLEDQAEKGWLLDKVSNFAWRFRRIEPQKIHFAVTYFPGASQFDPSPGARQRELFEFCAHSGWVLAGTTAQIQIFYNEQENPLPIETDPMMELENIHRSVKKSFLPSFGLLFLLALVQIWLRINQLRSNPLYELSMETTLFNWFCQAVLLVITGQELIGYFLWYRRARKAAENGEFVETRGHRKFQMVLLWCLLAGLAMQVVILSPLYGISMLITIGMFAVIYGIVFAATHFMKRQGTDAKTNRNVTMVLAVILSVVVTMAVGCALVRVGRNPVWEKDRIVGTTQVNGHTFDIYGDEIPLRIEELTDISSPDYSREARVQASPVLRREEYSQMIWGPSALPDLRYIIYTTRIPAIYDLCVRRCTKSQFVGNEDTYGAIDPGPWGAGAAYQLYVDGMPRRTYILCYDRKVVILHPGWDLTEEQMAAVGQILGS